jgi:glutathione S-transferase
MHLYIGNKNYSSWSMRPWLAMTAFGLEFDETLVPLDTAEFAPTIGAVSGAGRVPVLVDESVTVWESPAIIEYLAEKFSELSIWPADPAARAHARAISAEMHAGFPGLRGACPMNLAKTYAARDRGADVAKDLSRIETIWREARARFGEQSDEPYLYGAFSAADAMYAPVVARFMSYQLGTTAEAANYMTAVSSHPAYVAWRESALAEPWVVVADEVDEEAVVDLRAKA